MVDSLVRVSRRVGWGADQLARDPWCRHERADPLRHQQSASTVNSPRQSNRQRGAGAHATAGVPRSESAAASVRRLNATSPEGNETTLHERFITTHEPVLAHVPKKGRPQSTADTGARPTRIELPAAPPSGRLNSKGIFAVPSVYI